MADLTQIQTSEEDRVAIADLLELMEPPWWQKNRYEEALARAYLRGRESTAP